MTFNIEQNLNQIIKLIITQITLKIMMNILVWTKSLSNANLHIIHTYIRRNKDYILIQCVVSS